MSILYCIALFLWVRPCDTSSIIVPRSLPYLFIILLWRTVTFIGIVSHSLWRSQELVSIDSIALKVIGLPVYLNFEGNFGGVIACKRIAVLRVFKSLRLSWHGVTEILWRDLRLRLWLLKTGPDPWPWGFLINKEFKDFPFFGPQPNTFRLIHSWWQLQALPFYFCNLLKSSVFLNSHYKRRTAPFSPLQNSPGVVGWISPTVGSVCTTLGQVSVRLKVSLSPSESQIHKHRKTISVMERILLCLYIPAMHVYICILFNWAQFS